MTRTINHNQLNEIIKLLYKQKDKQGRKIPLFIYGTFGVGKSYVTRGTAMELAKERGREFIEWNKITHKQKDEVIKNLKKYFVFTDIRLSEFDSSDIKGLPDFNKTKDGDVESIDWKIPLWATILAKEDSDGVLFFDEINLAPPMVQSSCYKIIYDRIIDDSKINDNWLIIGAGNKESDRASTSELAPPLRDRGCEVELEKPTGDDWVSNFAIPHNIDSRIIGFISWKNGNLQPKIDFEDGQKFTTSRGWERIDTLIKGVEDFKQLELITSIGISEGIAREFVAFCKIQDTVKIEEIIKNPKKLESVKEISIRYFIVTALAERYKDKKIDFAKLIEISEVLDEMSCAEFVTLFWRLSFKYAPDKFRKDYTGSAKSENEKKIKAKYNKYLI